MDTELFHQDALMNYWTIVDGVLIFMFQLYSYFSFYLQLNSEILKNIYTMYFV